MRIIFTNVNYQKRVEYTSLFSVIPPLDLAYCAALVRQELSSAEVEILDANVLGLSDEEVIARIKRAEPDIVVFTSATHSINTVKRIIGGLAEDKMLRVLIGTHGSALPDVALGEIPGLDVVVRGEPELTLLELIRSHAKSSQWSGILGIHYRMDHAIAGTEDRPLLRDLEFLPFPARDLLPNNLYSAPYSSGVTALRTTRGCPGRCKFCDSHLLFGSKIRTRKPERVVDEIEECLKDYRLKYFAIIDHTFTMNRKFVIAVCKEIIDRKLNRKVLWACNTRVDMLNDEMLGLMKHAGCLEIGIGIESGDNARLASVGKGINEDQIKEAIGRIKHHGIIAMGYSIIGFADDTAESIALTRKKIFAFNPHTLQLSFAAPLPGSQLYADCIREDRILSDDWNDYVFLRKSIIRNDELSSEELERMRREIVKSFYFRPGKILELIFLVLFRSRMSVLGAFRAFWKIVFNVKK